jgi:hypothetical protein
MSLDFSALKKMSGSAGLADVAKEFEKMQKKAYEKDDETYWYPDTDKAGNSRCEIRFLPASVSDIEAFLKKGIDKAPPFVRTYSYSIKYQGKYYIENSLETLGQTDPVSEIWSKWYRELGKDHPMVQLLARKMQFVSNVLVIKDQHNPENNGTVRRFRYGVKVFNKLKAKMEPEDDDTPVNPFDPWEGMNFKLNIKKVKDWRNYDDSEWKAQSKLGTDKEIETIWRQCHSLQECIDPKHFKTYDELKARITQVLGPALNGIGLAQAVVQPGTGIAADDEPAAVREKVEPPPFDAPYATGGAAQTTSAEEAARVALFQKIARGDE